jgi:hypothetical protein
MTLKNVWRSLKVSTLAGAMLFAGSLLLTTGCCDECEDECGRVTEKCDSCPGATVEKK